MYMNDTSHRVGLAGCRQTNRIAQQMLVADPARVQTPLNPGGISYGKWRHQLRKVDVIRTR